MTFLFSLSNKMQFMNTDAKAWAENILPWLQSHGVRIIFILVGAMVVYYVARIFIQRIIRVTVVSDNHTSPEAEIQRENTLIRLFTWAVNSVLTVVVIITILKEIGLDIAPLLAGAGIVGIAVGFGGQYLIKDFLTGFFMMLENQYRIGDSVSLDNTSGTVEDISLRMTTLRDLNGTVHHVPHGDIKRVSNMSKDYARINLNVAVTYQAKLDKVITLINKVGSELANDPDFKNLFIKPPQFFRVDEITPAAIVIKIIGETLPSRQWELTGELRRRLIIEFQKEGIAMPPNQILHYNPDQPFLPDAS